MISQKAEFPIGLAKSKTTQEQPVEAGRSKRISAGLSNLTPRSLSGVFDESFELYKRNFGVLALIVALVYIPTQILVYAVSNLVLRPTAAQSASSDADFTSAFMTVILSFLIGSPQEGLPGYLPLLLSYIASGPLSKTVSSLILGERASVHEAFKKSGILLLRLFFAWGLFSLIVIALGLVAWILIFFLYTALAIAIAATGLMAIAAEVAIFIAVLLVIAPYFLITAFGAQFFAFVGPVMAIERLNIAGALIRSAQLVRKGLFLRTWMALSLLPLVIYGLQLLILQSSSSFTGTLHLTSWAEFVLITGFSNAVCFFFQPYWMIFLTLLYYDFRIRREGLDIRMMFDLPTVATPKGEVD